MQAPLFDTHDPLVRVEAVHCAIGAPFVGSGLEPRLQLYVALAPNVGLDVAIVGADGLETETIVA